jgi:DNA polymerase-1
VVNKHPLADCENCPYNGREHAFVPSYGPEQADLVIIGEAPGFNEIKSGKPFVGMSGQLLNAVLEGNNLNREEAFLTNVVLCRPKDNGVPSKLAIKACSKRLHQEISSREPKRILALGGTAASSVFQEKVKITQFRAGPPKQAEQYPGVSVVPTLHPAACLRAPDSFPHLANDVAKLVNVTKTAIWQEPAWRAFTTPNLAISALKQIGAKYDHLVIDIETDYDKDADFVQAMHYPILCIGISYDKHKVAVIGQPACSDPQVQAELKSLLETKKITCHNGKFDLSGMAHISDTAQLYNDTMLASYVLDERAGVHGLEYLSTELLGAERYKHMVKSNSGGRSGSFGSTDSDTLFHYNAYDCSNTRAIEEIQLAEINAQPDLRKLLDFLLDASTMLMHVEREGIKVDTDALTKLGNEYVELLDSLELELQRYVGGDFNPRSPMQVTAALRNFNVNVTTTDAEQLQKLVDNKHKYMEEVGVFCRLLLEYRKEQKQYGTYIKGIQKRLFQGRIHTTYNLHGTTSGRLSSRNPNLQNIPRGPNIKRMFVPEQGNAFVQADFSQIEYRTVACLAKEGFLAEIFNDQHRDVFGEFAEQIFGPNWTKAHRQIVKRIIHGSNYGMGPGTLTDQVNEDARKMGVVGDAFTVVQGKAFQLKYMKLVPNLVKWQKSIKHKVIDLNQDLVTPFGRHRRFQLITNDNKHDIEKEALAFMPQSISSDICLAAGMGLRLALPAGAAIRLFVHDSIMVECKQADVEKVSRLMIDMMMESGSHFSDYVPFAVDIKSSDKSWAEV